MRKNKNGTPVKDILTNTTSRLSKWCKHDKRRSYILIATNEIEQSGPTSVYVEMDGDLGVISVGLSAALVNSDGFRKMVQAALLEKSLQSVKTKSVTYLKAQDK